MTFVAAQHLQLLRIPGERRVAANPVSAEGLRRFLQGVMERHPLYIDGTVAAASRFGERVAPPLYPIHALTPALGSADPLERLSTEPDWDGAADGAFGLPPLDFPLKRIVNGGTEAEFFQLARIGDVISVQSMYERIEDREGRSGPMVVVTIASDYRNQDEELLTRVRITLIRR